MAYKIKNKKSYSNKEIESKIFSDSSNIGWHGIDTDKRIIKKTINLSRKGYIKKK